MNELDETTDVTFEDAPPATPFRAMVLRRFEAMPSCGCVDKFGDCRCAVGIRPRVNKATIYHQLRKLGRWETASPARVAFVRRLHAADAPKRKADELAWRLLEEMLFWNEHEAGINLAVIDVELDALLAYGEEREYPERPNDADVAAALEEARNVFREDGLGRIPPTILHFYRRLGLWRLASKYLQLKNELDGDEIESVSSSVAWRILAFPFILPKSVAEIADELRRLVNQSMHGSMKAAGLCRPE